GSRCLRMFIRGEGGEKDERGSQGPLASQWAALTTGGVEATLSLQSDWGSGYCADVFLDNHGDTPVTSWSVTLNTRQSSISQLWSGARGGDTVTAVGMPGFLTDKAARRSRVFASISLRSGAQVPTCVPLRCSRKPRKNPSLTGGARG